MSDILLNVVVYDFNIISLYLLCLNLFIHLFILEVLPLFC